MDGAVIDEMLRRQHRAAVARRVVEKAPAVAAELDWGLLAVAPAWLALSEADLGVFARRVGAVLCAPAVRLWIDGPRIAAVRSAVGGDFLQALLAETDVPAIEAGGQPRLDSAERVPTLLQATGSGVLLAALPHGALRRAASDVLGPAVDLAIPADVARSLIERTRSLEAM
jgi:hypothetical protein